MIHVHVYYLLPTKYNVFVFFLPPKIGLDTLAFTRVIMLYLVKENMSDILNAQQRKSLEDYL